MTIPGNKRYIDWHENRTEFVPGDVIELRNSPLPKVDDDDIFRIKELEIFYSHETYRTRMHLATRYESSSRYLKYIDHDVGESTALYVNRRSGSFQLDFSALDSLSHLD